MMTGNLTKQSHDLMDIIVNYLNGVGEIDADALIKKVSESGSFSKKDEDVFYHALQHYETDCQVDTISSECVTMKKKLCNLAEALISGDCSEFNRLADDYFNNPYT
jgi:hypothetical protein